VFVVIRLKSTTQARDKDYSHRPPSDAWRISPIPAAQLHLVGVVPCLFEGSGLRKIVP
jgi:hypothetical protein